MSNWIWGQTVILRTRSEHIQLLFTLQAKAENVYQTLSNHLLKISNQNQTPSDISTLVYLFGEFDNINTEIDRAMLNIYIYINNIRMKHLGCHMQTSHMDQMGSLLSMISEQRRCIPSADYTGFLENLNDTKNKNPETNLPFLALQEKKAIKILLNGLVSLIMMTNFIIKHLEQTDNCLDSIDINLKNENAMYY